MTLDAGRVGKQKIEDTGHLTTKRMETVDGEFLNATMGFIDKNAKANKPFFVWFNSTRMHIYTHLKPESQGKTGLGLEADGMVEHDGVVGQLLKQLDDLGIADNTIVLYTTDNGAGAGHRRTASADLRRVSAAAKSPGASRSTKYWQSCRKAVATASIDRSASGIREISAASCAL